VTDAVNIFGDLEWDRDNDREGYRHRVTAIGKRLGAELLGASVYELPPGERTWPYHYETASEEWLLVVAGSPTLRTPDGEQELAPGDVAVFPRGPEGGHKLENRTAETVRLVIFSSKGPLDVIHYPDSGKVGIWTLSAGYIAMLRNEPQLDYWDGETG
jgi:uncharacterized cupin superfamily protein